MLASHANPPFYPPIATEHNWTDKGRGRQYSQFSHGVAAVYRTASDSTVQVFNARRPHQSLIESQRAIDKLAIGSTRRSRLESYNFAQDVQSFSGQKSDSELTNIIPP